MTKRTITETIREYDAEGHLTRETVTETIEDDDSTYINYTPFNPCPYYPTYTNTPSCTTTSATSITYATNSADTEEEH